MSSSKNNRRDRLGAIALVIVTFCFVYCSPAAETEEQLIDDGVRERKAISVLLLERLRIPAPAEIEEMSIECYGYSKAIRPFTVPKKHYETILAAFGEPVFHVNMTVGLDECGCVRLVTKQGTVHHLIWYWTGKCPLVYSLYGIPCMRKSSDEKDVAESLILGDKIREISEESNSR